MNSNSSFLAQFFSTPPITRMLSLSILVVIVSVYINLISPYMLMYSPLFLGKGEVWRIFTCFLYFGKPSLDVLIHITFLYRYSRMLEEGFIYSSDYFWLVFIISSLLFLIATVFNISLLASAFSSTITYIWTRRNPHALVQIFGFISFPAFYLPFIVPLFMLITEKRVLTEDLLGIVVGHVYFFFKDVYPKWGSDIFRTPCFIKKIFGEHGDQCCRKTNYRTLNLNTIQPVPAMETIILEDTVLEEEAPEGTSIVHESINNTSVHENTSIQESINNTSVHENTSIQESINTSVHENTSIQENTSILESINSTPNNSLSQSEDLEISDEKINKFLDEKEEQEKDWVENWSSESLTE